jgi:hypothetical protein
MMMLRSMAKMHRESPFESRKKQIHARKCQASRKNAEYKMMINRLNSESAG